MPSNFKSELRDTKTDDGLELMSSDDLEMRDVLSPRFVVELSKFMSSDGVDERRVTGFARTLHDFTIQQRNLHSLMNVEMTESDFEKIISSSSTIQTFSYNQLIFRELDEAESLYYVLGEVDLFLTNTILETTKAGRFIGHESGFIDRIHVVSARCSVSLVQSSRYLYSSRKQCSR